MVPMTITSSGQELLAPPWSSVAIEAKASYERYQFVQIDDFFEPHGLSEVLRPLSDRLRPYATRRIQRHSRGPNGLGVGHRFSRVDYGPHEGAQPAHQLAIGKELSDCGFTEFTRQLGAASKPLIEMIVGRSVSYDRALLLMYDEGDYISHHGDNATVQRIRVQLPFAFHCRTALRVLQDSFLETHYDDPGSLRILGPSLWHEVPPVLADTAGHRARRIVVTLRFAIASP